MNNLSYARDFLLDWIKRQGPTVLLVAAMLIVGHVAGKKLKEIIKAAMIRRKADPLLADFIAKCLYYAVMVAVLFAAAGEFGIDTTSFLAIAGSGLLALGLAVKDNLSNFSSGILLVFMRPFTIGDWINVSGASGSVEKISMSTTILNTADNRKVYIPNRKLLLDSFVNDTANPTRRIDLVIGIGYDDDIETAKAVIRRTLEADPRLLADPPLYMVAAELGDSSVNLFVRPWVATRDFFRAKMEFTEAIKIALDKAGISIPYPQRDVHIVSPSENA